MEILKHLTTVQKYPDLQVHVRLVAADGQEFVDVRDYVPSAEQYGRGILLPLTDAAAVAAVGNAIVDATYGGQR